MARYRKVDPRIWRDEKFRKLTPEQKAIALYVLTNPSNDVGFVYLSDRVAHEIGSDAKAFVADLRTVCAELQWAIDESLRTVFLPPQWRWGGA